ncbi:hypothetical protein ACU635_50675 [[Actinomadura] parvosata]|uniref:hypothetical protein n=1 Tax=[Actinomadura] parvosata TaxID=1955412 RepID=UPI00406D3E15
MTPTVGQIVHYVSYGTPGGEYTSQCRAAIITEINGQGADEAWRVGLAVLNPEGMYFSRDAPYHDGTQTPGSPNCLTPEYHGQPYRYCSCGWMEASYAGGTWHWPERTPTREQPIVVNIQVASDANHADIGHQVVEAIKEYERRRGGPQPA